MGYLYVLLMNNGKYYVWSSKNIDKRMEFHLSWCTYTTKNKDPKLVFSKKFDTLKDARCRELFIKKMKSKKVIEQIIAGNREWKK